MFKALVALSLSHRMFVIIGSLLLAAYGTYLLPRLPVDVFPDLNRPTVTLLTEAEGYAPQEVEQLVTYPLETALNGMVDEQALHAALQAHYFVEPPPKSLDRNAFDGGVFNGLSLAAGAATLAAFTAESIARAREHFPQEPAIWVVCGGGRKNRAIMTRLAERVENAVVPVEALGLNGDSIEAEAWAYMAVRSVENLPLTFPGTTGVPVPISGGVIARL